MGCKVSFSDMFADFTLPMRCDDAQCPALMALDDVGVVLQRMRLAWRVRPNYVRHTNGAYDPAMAGTPCFAGPRGGFAAPPVTPRKIIKKPVDRVCGVLI